MSKFECVKSEMKVWICVRIFAAFSERRQSNSKKIREKFRQKGEYSLNYSELSEFSDPNWGVYFYTELIGFLFIYFVIFFELLCHLSKNVAEMQKYSWDEISKKFQLYIYIYLREHEK